MKNNNAALTLLALTCTALAACTTDTGPTPRPSRLSNYAPPPAPSQYGDWYIEPATCTIRSRASDFTFQTDGRPSKQGTITLKALFAVPVVQPPRVEVSEILVPVPVEGAGRGYNIVLAYDSMNAAHMLKDDTYLMVNYQPINSSDILQSSFSTRGLMMALVDLAKYCD